MERRNQKSSAVNWMIKALNKIIFPFNNLIKIPILNELIKEINMYTFFYIKKKDAILYNERYD